MRTLYSADFVLTMDSGNAVIADGGVASLLAKLRAMDAAALDSWQALRMDTPRMTPVFWAGPHANLHHNLVHAVRGSDVDPVVVDGAVVPGLFARRAEYLAAHDDAPVALSERTADDR